jgi:hypothetical protein
MNDQEQRHVFISYVRENQDQVDRLCQDLERHGVNVWLDRNSIKPGARWKDAIREAIRQGDFFIACFSNEYTTRTVIDRKKTHMNEELTIAIEELRQYDTSREWFIPILLSECDIPARSIGPGETLKDINWVTLSENWDAGIKRIVSVIMPTAKEVQSRKELSKNIKGIESLWTAVTSFNILFLFNLWWLDRTDKALISIITPDDRWESVPIFGLSLGSVFTLVSFGLLFLFARGAGKEVNLGMIVFLRFGSATIIRIFLLRNGCNAFSLSPASSSL